MSGNNLGSPAIPTKFCENLNEKKLISTEVHQVLTQLSRFVELTEVPTTVPAREPLETDFELTLSVTCLPAWGRPLN